MRVRVRLNDDLGNEQRQRKGGVENELAVELDQGGFFLERGEPMPAAYAVQVFRRDAVRPGVIARIGPQYVARPCRSASS
jgi:hypothetical protein